MLNVKALIIAFFGTAAIAGVGGYVYYDSFKDSQDPLGVFSNNQSDGEASDPSGDAVDDSIASLGNESSDNIEIPSEISSDIVADTDAQSSDEASTEAQDDTLETDNAAAGDDTQPESVTDSWQKPSFDVVRLEPDGSTLIAGRGEPDKTLSLLQGDTVLNTVDIDGSGEFVIVFDQPLDPGEYALVMQLSDAEGNAVLSDQTAVLNVPDNNDAELLVMVTEEGVASRFINVPKPEIVEPEIVEMASATDISADGTNAAQTEVADNENGGASSQNDVNVADAGSDTSSDASDNSVIPTPEIASSNEDTAQTIPVPNAATSAAETVAAQETPDAVDTMDTKKEMAKTETKTVPDVNIRIEAVEVEGDKIFVAGSASQNYQVRVFADEKEIGVSKVDANGRFLLESIVSLTVGRHDIAAALEDENKNVVLRAVVPFNRPEGEAVAAVAQAGETNEALANDDVANSSVPVPLVEGDAGASGIEVAQSESSVTIPTPVETDAALNVTIPVPTETVSESAEMAKAADVQPPKPAINEDVQPSLSADATQNEDGTQKAEQEVAAASDGASSASSSENTSEPQTIVQDELAISPSKSVIIRRGDTLWHIARRTYGAGVRYTTIYLANQDQIQDPDLIQPGQVFTLPEDEQAN